MYGLQGYALVDDATSYPADTQVTLAGTLPWTWQAPTTDVRALQRASGAGRVAATWYNNDTFTIDLNLAAGTAHQVALYSVDWGGTTRSQRIDILDAGTGATLDTRTVTGFNGGTYLVWTLSGHVTIRVTRTAGPNAVVSGLFFDTANSSLGNGPPTVSLTAPSGRRELCRTSHDRSSATASDSDGSISRGRLLRGLDPRGDRDHSPPIRPPGAPRPPTSTP